MNKTITILTLCLLTIFFSNAQENSLENSQEYNRWSIDINGGLSRPTQPLTEGYFVDDFSLFHIDLGIRYMFNPKFGLKTDIGYDKFKESKNSLPFDGEYYRFNLQGVANLGRIMNFEEWTQRLNIQFHTGLGYAFMKNDVFVGKDEMVNVLLGFTGQIKISERIAFNADFTMINNVSQHYTFDGNTGGDGEVIKDRGFNATLYNATVGFSIYLGKHGKHADWTPPYNKQLEEVEKLENRVAELETMLNDTDKDGVPDYLDVEPNTITGLKVDTRGRAIDKNNNGVPDEIESYIDAIKKSDGSKEGKSIVDMINGGYVNVYFDTDSSRPTKSSYDAINFITQYLKSNPNASVQVIGYADEIGSSEYNNSLSAARANAVKEIIIKTGVDTSRLVDVAKGEDASVDVNSADARKLVRRVTFKLK